MISSVSKDMDPSKLKVVLSGVPDGCELKQIKTEILINLNANKDAVTKVKKCRYPNGEIIPGKMEVELASNECEYEQN